jgi:hypothetical protein
VQDVGYNFNKKQKNMERNQIKWLVIALMLVAFFIFFTPMTFFLNNSIITPMIEGFVIAFIIFLSVLNINSFYELTEIDEIEKSKNLSSVLIPFISFFFFWTVINLGINYRINFKLENEGIFTNAQIINGYELRTESFRRGTTSSYNVEISFTDTISRKDYKVLTEIDHNIFKSIHKDQSVEIKYLKSDPTVFKLIAGDENVKKFKNISNRNIEIVDIEILMGNKKSTKNLNYLNSISSGWVLHKDERGDLFINELKKETIGLSRDNKLFYEGENIDLITYKLKKISSEPLKDSSEIDLLNSRIDKYIYKDYIITLTDKLVSKSENIIQEKYLVFEKKL